MIGINFDTSFQVSVMKCILLFIVLFSCLMYYLLSNKISIATMSSSSSSSSSARSSADAAADDNKPFEIKTCVPVGVQNVQSEANAAVDSEVLNEIYRRQERRMRDSRSEQVELTSTRISADGKYMYYDRVSIGNHYVDLSLQYKTCLATQSSLDRLYPLLEMNDHWDGPLSVAVFIGGDEDYNVFRDYIYLLETCYPRMLHKMMFSLMSPVTDTPINSSYSKKRMAGLTCRDSDTIMEELLESRAHTIRDQFTKSPYPQNHLRNLALHNCIAEFEYLVDVDLVPVKGMANALNSFLSMMENCRKCAFVVPTYEIRQDVRTLPRNKNQLLSLKESGQARPYHQKVFPESQSATNYTKWEKSLNIYGSPAYVSHHLSNFEFFYEPFYISTAAAPHYDERFIGYGYTRNSQAYEMYLAGFNFKIISPLFTVHRGMKEVNDWPEYRVEQNRQNAKRFVKFKHNLIYKYKLNEPRPKTISVNITIASRRM